MPSPTEILAGLGAIANRATGAAIIWHAVLGAVLVALLSGWRPSQRLARALLALPLASVAAFAFSFGNPFNGALFAIATLVVLALSVVGARGAVSRGSRWAFALGVATLAFGWVYPHFLETSAFAYLYAAPVGLIPCPTLAVTIGLALLGGGMGSRSWSLALAAMGLFYGFFGVLRLGVLLDLGLLVGTLALVATAFGANANSRSGALVPRFESPR